MELVLIIGLIVLGIVFLILEVFLIPGISVAGIGSAICFIAGISVAYLHLGVATGTAILAGSALVTGIILYWFFKSKTLDNMALQSSIDSVPQPFQGLNIKPGDTGIAISRLAPIGNVQFKGVIIEGRSENEIIESGTAVVLVEVGSNNVLVHKLEA
jgi:membrane-bound ClpP family serine protease